MRRKYTPIINEFIKIVIILIISTIIIFPIFYTFIFSMYSKEQEGSSATSSLLPETLNSQNFLEALNGGYWNALLYSFLFSLTLVIFRLFIFITGGYALSQKSKLRKPLFIFLLILSLIPENALITQLFRQFNHWKINTGSFVIFGLAFPSIYSLFGILLFKNAFQNVSNAEKMMMKIDSLTFYRKFTVVFLPKMNLAITLSVITGAATAWNSYLWPALFTFGSDNSTLSTWIFKIGRLPTGGFSLSVRLAGSILFMIPIIVVYTIFNKKIRKSFQQIL